jgi:hypothetical protein
MNVTEQELSLMLIEGGRAKFTVTIEPPSHLKVRPPIAVANGSLVVGRGR